MKIAVFYNLPFSGAKRTVFEHVKALKKRGHTIDVYTIDTSHDIFDPGRVADNEYRYDYKKRIVQLPFLKHLTNDLSDFYLLKSLNKKIAKDIDEKHYDVALIHTDKLTQAPFITRFLKTKNVYFCLEPLKIAYEYGLRMPTNLSYLNRLYERWNRETRKRIDRENAQAAGEICAISYFGRELVIQAFDLYPKISYLGVDTKKFSKRNIKKKNQILFIGQKIKINGYSDALEAVKLVPRNIRPELKVLSIGNGGKLTDEEIVDLYNESLMTLSLSNFDTFGLVAIESLSCEVPVIAYNVAGYRETMLDKRTGYLVEFSPRAIAEKITYLLDHPEKRIEFGKRGREWVKKQWTWEKQIEKLERILKEA